MAEVLGVISSVIAIVGLVGRQIEYFGKVKDGKKDKERLLREIQYIAEMLANLEKRVKKTERKSWNEEGQVLIRCLEEMKKDFHKLKDKLGEWGKPISNGVYVVSNAAAVVGVNYVAVQAHRKSPTPSINSASSKSSRLSTSQMGPRVKQLFSAKQPAVKFSRKPKEVIQAAGSCIATLVWPFKADEINEILHSIERYKTWLTIGLAGNTQSLLQEMEKEMERRARKLQQGIDNIAELAFQGKHREILGWLSDLNFSEVHEKKFGEWHEETGIWLLKEQDFQAWVDLQSQPQTAGKSTKHTLFCHGCAGAGKSVLASMVINHLTKNICTQANTAVVFVYCSYDGKNVQNTLNLLCNILHQLIVCNKKIEVVEELHKKCHNGKNRPDICDVRTLIGTILSELCRVFLVIDGLDELLDSEMTKFTAEIQKLCEKFGNDRLRIMVTSRWEVQALCNNAAKLEIKASKKDVEAFIKGAVSKHPKLNEFITKEPKLETEIIKKIGEKTHGMFLLARLHLDEIAVTAQCGGPKKVKKMLDKLPEKLNETYDRAMKRIAEHDHKVNRTLALRVLELVTCSARPLSIQELRYALAVEDADELSDIHQDELADINHLLSICAGLVTVNTRASQIGLVHYSAKQYFDTYVTRPNALFTYADAHDHIFKTCIKYLSYDGFGTCETTLDSLVKRLHNYPFLYYAAHKLPYHLERAKGFTAKEGPRREQLVTEFLGKKMNIAATIQAISATRMPRYNQLDIETSSQKHNIDNYVSIGAEPLLAASFLGFEDFVEAFLTKGAGDPLKIRDSFQESAVGLAAESGHVNILKILLQREKLKPLVTCPDKWDRTPLYYAAESGFSEVIDYLLSIPGVAVDTRNQRGMTPFAVAASRGNVQVIERLLAIEDPPVDQNSADNANMTPLAWAAKEGHTEVVERLLSLEGERKVDPNIRHNTGVTPLAFAANFGHEEIVKALLALPDIDVDFKDVRGNTALSWAAGRGYANIVRMLLEREDVDPNWRGYCGQTPLAMAAVQGHPEVVAMILASRQWRPPRQIDVMREDDKGLRPLDLAKQQAQYWSAAAGKLDITKEERDNAVKREEKYKNVIKSLGEAEESLEAQTVEDLELYSE